MMSASHVDPFYLPQLLSELFFNTVKSIDQRLNILFTQSMEMKTTHALGKLIRKITSSDSKA